jgi:hypothetical protein
MTQMSCLSRRSTCSEGAGAVPVVIAALAIAGFVSCTPTRTPGPEVPRGYVSVLRLREDGKNLSFGPFVGYYFRPKDPHDVRVLDVLCFNERSFYTRDVTADALLFEGTAQLTTLPDVGRPLGDAERINPVFFNEAPAQWTGARPSPTNEFLHFHSCYSAAGPVLTGYWLRHAAVTNFLYDMGGRVAEGSPLHHFVRVGVDTGFARIIEFDRGPGE